MHPYLSLVQKVVFFINSSKKKSCKHMTYQALNQNKDL